MSETFKTIPTHTKYEISKSGQVRHRKHKRVLTPSCDSNGYLQVSVYNDKKQRTITTCIHHLMSATYMPKKPNGHEINFRDRNKENVNLENFRYLPLDKNRPRKYPVKYCKNCGKKLKTGRVHCCSKSCRWTWSRKLVECEYCGSKFYRLKSIIKACRPDRGYTKGRIYCNQVCRGADRAKNAKKRKEWHIQT